MNKWSGPSRSEKWLYFAKSVLYTAATWNLYFLGREEQFHFKNSISGRIHIFKQGNAHFCSQKLIILFKMHNIWILNHKNDSK